MQDPTLKSRTSESPPFLVADISMSEFGRKEIEIAEHEMPGLIAIREKYSSERPLEGVRITGSLHMTIQTAVLIETLVEFGASAVGRVVISSLRKITQRQPSQNLESQYSPGKG